MNRRQWLKTSSLATAGLLASASFPSCGKGAPVSGLSLDPAGTVKLNSNESPYGISERMRKVMIDSLKECHLYPHKRYPELIERIAFRENLAPENVILGAGSTEVMNRILRAFGTSGPVLAADPTYFDFLFYARLNNCAVEFVPLTETYAHDIPAMLERITPETSFVYVCNPNNPTGSITAASAVRTLCENSESLVFVDEAYHEYVEDAAYSSAVDLVRAGKNVVVTRTFSKIFGMAGLRVGYGLAHPDIIKKLEDEEMNFAPIAFPSLMAAVMGWEDRPFLQSVLDKTLEARAYLESRLDQRGIRFIPSHTNFVLYEVKRTAEDVAADFARNSVLVRPFQFGDRQWIRVTIGTAGDMQKFVSALDKI